MFARHPVARSKVPHLRAISYNVRYFGHGTRGLASQDRQLRRVAETLAALDEVPDLVCLQEVETNSLRADLTRTLAESESEAPATQFTRFVDAFHGALERQGQEARYHHYYFPAHQYRLGRRRNLYTTGLAILVRDRYEVLRHNAVAPYDITHRRQSSLSRFKQTRIVGHVRLQHQNGQILDCYNTHLSLPSFLSKAFWSGNERMGYGENQLEEARRLVEFIEHTAAAGSARLVVGDFNSRPGSPVHDFLTRQVGLRDAFRWHHEADAERVRLYPTAGVLGLRLPIDYMFSCSSVEWLDFESTHHFGLKPGLFHGLSDHVPLVARFRLPTVSERLRRAA
jgi:endonuclease/exonuclease/phosphatase family metal-dependent hydrolase